MRPPETSRAVEVRGHTIANVPPKRRYVAVEAEEVVRVAAVLEFDQAIPVFRRVGDYVGNGDSLEEQRGVGAKALPHDGRPPRTRETKPTTFETLTLPNNCGFFSRGLFACRSGRPTCKKSQGLCRRPNRCGLLEGQMAKVELEASFSEVRYPLAIP
jgi:hypothetical protein